MPWCGEGAYCPGAAKGGRGATITLGDAIDAGLVCLRCLYVFCGNCHPHHACFGPDLTVAGTRRLPYAEREARARDWFTRYRGDLSPACEEWLGANAVDK